MSRRFSFVNTAGVQQHKLQFQDSWKIPGEFQVDSWQMIGACLPLGPATRPCLLLLSAVWGLVLIEATWCQAHLESEPTTIMGLCVSECVFSNKAGKEQPGESSSSSPTDWFFLLKTLRLRRGCQRVTPLGSAPQRTNCWLTERGSLADLQPNGTGSRGGVVQPDWGRGMGGKTWRGAPNPRSRSK